MTLCEEGMIRDNKNVQNKIRHSGKVDQAWIIILTNPVISMNMIGLEHSKSKKTSKKQEVKPKKEKDLNLTTRSWLYNEIIHP